MPFMMKEAMSSGCWTYIRIHWNKGIILYALVNRAIIGWSGSMHNRLYNIITVVWLKI